MKFIYTHQLDMLSRDTLYAARAARDILWKELPLQKFVEISQTYDLSHTLIRRC